MATREFEDRATLFESPREETILQCDDICFHYIKSVLVLDSVNISLAKGSINGLIGCNGSGKSTLLRIFAGLQKPSKGALVYNGSPVQGIHRRQLARYIGYVPQTVSAVFPFTGLEVVLTGRTPWLGRFQTENQEDRLIALHALEMMGQQQLAYKSVLEMSEGERQLVSVARVIAQRPAVILLDEPSSALDLKHRAILMRAMGYLRDRYETTVLLVTHDISLIDSRVDMLHAMKGGRIIATGTPETVLTRGNLAEIYADPNIRTIVSASRTFVWSE